MFPLAPGRRANTVKAITDSEPVDSHLIQVFSTSRRLAFPSPTYALPSKHLASGSTNSVSVPIQYLRATITPAAHLPLVGLRTSGPHNSRYETIDSIDIVLSHSAAKCRFFFFKLKPITIHSQWNKVACEEGTVLYNNLK
jgi:hypothetical protein